MTTHPDIPTDELERLAEQIKEIVWHAFPDVKAGASICTTYLRNAEVADANARLIAIAPALLRELIQLRAEVEALRALLRTGCDLLAIEREALREGISIGGVMSPGPEDVAAVEALNEIDDWIASATATLTAGDSHDD